jgi:hypothetical protein
LVQQLPRQQQPFVNEILTGTTSFGISDELLIAHASSPTKPGRHDIAEILLKVALNTKKSN